MFSFGNLFELKTGILNVYAAAVRESHEIHRPSFTGLSFRLRKVFEELLHHPDSMISSHKLKREGQLIDLLAGTWR